MKLEVTIHESGVALGAHSERQRQQKIPSKNKYMSQWNSFGISARKLHLQNYHLGS
jgi:hypothetical protein